MTDLAWSPQVATMQAPEIHASKTVDLLRHTCATHMHDNGADIRFIQQLLGHARLDTTQIYTEVSIVKLAEVHQRTHPHGKLQEPRRPTDAETD